jgi:hypothetical protein
MRMITSSSSMARELVSWGLRILRRMRAVAGFFILLVSLLSPVPLAAQTSDPNHPPDPATATATQWANWLNGLTPQAVPQQTILLGTLQISPGATRMVWNPSAPFSYCPGSGGGNLVLINPPVCPTINSFNIQYEILISKPANYDLQVVLTNPTVGGGSEDIVGSLGVITGGLFQGATTATFAFHPHVFAPQTLKFSHSGALVGCDFPSVTLPCSFTIKPYLQPQLGAFVVPYLPVAIVYQPPGCGQCPPGSTTPCGSTAYYAQGTQLGTTLSWGTSSTSGTIKSVDADQFFNDMSQGASIASYVASLFPGGQAAAGGFNIVSKVFGAVKGLYDSQTTTTLSITKSQTEAVGWVFSAKEEFGPTAPCQGSDLFVYLKDVLFVYAVIPKDPLSGNVTPDGVPTVVLVPLHHDGPVHQRTFPQLQSDLPAAVVERFRELDLQMNPPKQYKPGTSLPGVGFKSGRGRPRLVPRPVEECPVGPAPRGVSVQEDQLSESETSQATTTTTLTNVTGLFASIAGQAGETTQSVTYSSAQKNWTTVSQSAGLSLMCPEIAPAHARDMYVYVDSVFDTLLAVPGPVQPTPSGTPPPVAGTINSQQGHPVGNTEVLLKTGGKSYRVFSDASGKFAFRFASIPKGPGVVVVGKDTFPISYNGSPLPNLSLKLSKTIGTEAIRKPTTAPVAPVAPLRNLPGVTASGAGPQTTPCCVITSINLRAGLASAKVNATGKTFQFKPSNSALLSSMKVGEAVYANFKTRQVSLDGKTPFGSIVSGP